MAQRSIRNGGRDKRRYARRATLLPALVHFGDEDAIRCEVRDYSQTGLYLAFLEGKPRDYSIAGLVGETIRVELPAGNGSGGTPLELTGRVVHASAAGFGASVPSMPDGALRTLGTARAGRGRAACDENRPDLSPQERMALRRECSGLLRPFLAAVIDDCFQRAGERLEAAIEGGLTMRERSGYSCGVRELTQHRERIRQGFFHAVADRFPDGVPAKVASDALQGADELRLVDEAELEDRLDLLAVVDRVEADNAAQIGALEASYSRLVGVPIDGKNNPFGPETICRAFRDALEGMDFDRSVRTILYRALGYALGRHAPDLYRQLNDRLAPLGQAKPPGRAAGKTPASPPSGTETGPAAQPQTPPEGAPRPAPAGIADPAAERPAPGFGPSSGPSQWGAALGPDQTISAPGGFLLSLADSPPFSPSQPADRSRTGAVSGARIARPDPLRLVQRLQRTIRQLPAPGNGASYRPAVPQDGGGSSLPWASLQDLIGALDSLPRVAAVPDGSAAPALTDALAARLAADIGGAKGLSPVTRQILESVVGLLDQVSAGLAPTSEVGSLVERLERPLLKLALKDKRFPGVPDHPARHVLNLIDQYAAGADDKGKLFDRKLQGYLHELVERIADRADRDPGVFETARDKLQKRLSPILEARRARVIRIQEACEGRQRVRSARALVNEVLDRRLGGRSVPGMVLRLLDAGWRQHLVLLATRHGPQGADWDGALEVLDRLAARLVAPVEHSSRAEDETASLLDEVRRGLATVSVDGPRLAAFLDELEELLAGIDTEGGQSRALVPIPPGKLAVAFGRGGEVASAVGGLAQKLRVGDWWDLSLTGTPVPMQLVWLGQPPSSCAFANRSGTDRLELTLSQLADRIRNGLAKPGKDLDLPLMERSEATLFDETYRQLMQQALHDPVTRLPNRKGFIQRLVELVLPSAGADVHTVCIIEFDQFRTIYDTCGVEAAEKLARSLADTVEKAREQVGPDSILAAFRDDTLALLVPRCASRDCSAAADLLSRFKEYRFQHEHHRYSIGLNIGLAEYAPPGVTAEEAVRRADSACIAAKSLGRNRIQVYEQASPELKTQESLMDWAGRIDSFLEGTGLYLRCQRIAPIAPQSGLLPYYEILLGIQGSAGREISPMDFIPAVTRLNRSHELDTWVIRKVFDWIDANPSVFASLGGFAINLSATSLGHPDVTDCIHRLLESRVDVPAKKIIFEITESAAIESYAAAREFIREIRRRYGCKFSLDDFGTGFTSYAHLKNLRTDALKIDGSFVKDMLESPGDYAMVESMNEIAHSLGLHTVAEYVESAAILDKLREIGVDYAQGYAIHKPCPIDRILPENGT